MARTLYPLWGTAKDTPIGAFTVEGSGSYTAPDSTPFTQTAIAKNANVSASWWADEQAHNSATWPTTTGSYSINVTSTTNMSTSSFMARRVTASTGNSRTGLYDAYSIDISTTGIKTGSTAQTDINTGTISVTDGITVSISCFQNGGHSEGALTISATSTFFSHPDLTAPAAGTNADAQTATATATANNASVSVKPSAGWGHVDGDAVSFNPSKNVSSSAVTSTAAASALDATVSTAGSTNAQAEAATATGTVSNAIGSAEGHFIENFEGTSGNTMTTGNTGFDVFKGTGSPTFQNSPTPIQGSTVGSWSSGSDTTRAKKDYTTGAARHFARAYFRVDALPAAQTRFLLFETSEGASPPGADIGGVLLRPDGKLRLRNSAGFGAETETTSAWMSTSEWIRIEVKLDLAADDTTLRVFAGANLHGTTPSETLTLSGVVQQANPVTAVNIGVMNVTPVVVYSDALEASTEDWVGPLSTGTASAEAATATASAYDATVSTGGTTPVNKDLTALWNVRSLVRASHPADQATERFTFESGTHGNDISTTENVGGGTLDGGNTGNGTVKYSNLHPHSGSLGMEIVLDSTTQVHRWVRTSANDETTTYLSFYLYLPSSNSPMGAGVTLARWFNNANTNIAQIWLATSEIMSLRDNSTTQGSTFDFSPYWDTLVRIDWYMSGSGGTGSQTLHLYSGANLESTNTANASESITNGTVSGAGGSYFRLGTGAVISSTFVEYWDDIGWNLTQNPGPAGAGQDDLTLLWNVAASSGTNALAQTATATSTANDATANTGGGTDNADEYEYFDSGTHGNSIGTTDLIFDGGVTTGTASFTYSNVQKVNGTLSGYFSLASGDTCTRTINISGSDQTLAHFRQYMYVPSVDILGGNGYFGRALRTGGALTARLSFNTSQALRMHNGTTGVGTGIDFDDNSLFDQWIRVEWKLDAVNDLQYLRVYKGANLHGTGTADYEDSGLFDDASGVGQFEIGDAAGATTNANSWYVDAIGWRLSDWVGPITVSGGTPATISPLVSIF